MERDHGSAYKEIERLHNLLTDAGVPHEYVPLIDGMQVIYAPGGVRLADAVQHRFSYGAEFGKVELMGLLTRDELECDPVKGFMTAEEVLQRMLDHWIAFQETVTKARVVFEGGRSPEAPTARDGGNGCQLFGNSEQLPDPNEVKFEYLNDGTLYVDMWEQGMTAILAAYRDGKLVPVKRGQWLPFVVGCLDGCGRGISLEGYKCSECGRFEAAMEPYCNCGALMQEVDHEEAKTP